MQNLLTELTKLLENDKRLVFDGMLMKNKVVELALQPDAGLLETLLSHPEIKRYFFQEINNFLIFDKIKFQQFVSDNISLPDSFAADKNKIGLTVNNNFIVAKTEVVLSWAYKDCYLEAGQTKEEKGRAEVFRNETLAPDQIERLLQPKCFCAFKKISSEGITIPKRLSENDNWLFKGDNLFVLHSLKNVFANKVKLIYIDPPYNTGSGSFLYNDSFRHSTWLTFMKNRLEVAWSLLAADGSIFIQVDDKEFAYLKVLCDEIFGRENCKENIVLKSSTESGVNAINVKRGERLFKVKENILFYAKSLSFRFNPFYTKTEYNIHYKYEVKKENGEYILKDLLKSFYEQRLNGKKKKDISTFEQIAIEQEFTQYALNNAAHIYSLEKNIKKAGEKFKQSASTTKGTGLVKEFINASGETILLYDGGSLVPLRDRIITENGNNYFAVLASDLWVDIGTTAASEGGVAFSNGKKPEKLLRRIIEMTTKENDIVLDYHLGSGTTAAVAHKLNRRYIGIELMDYGENDSVMRLKNVIQGDTTGISKTVNWKGGGSFVYAELEKSNQSFIDAILNARTNIELDEVWKSISKKAFLSYEVDKLAIEKYQLTFDKLETEAKKKILLSLLDLNQLYVPFSEMEELTNDISIADKELNKQFYSLKIN